MISSLWCHMTIDSLLSGFVGAIVGGLLAGGFSLWAVYATERIARQNRTDQDNKVIKGLLQALHDELDVIFNRYQVTMGSRLEALPKGNPLLSFYPVISDFFTVYNANASLIGHIDDHDLRRALVRTYVLAKGLVDSFRMNNEMLAKYEYWNALVEETKLPVHQQKQAACHKALVEYAVLLKQSHAEVVASQQDLMRMLYKRGVLHVAQPAAPPDVSR